MKFEKLKQEKPVDNEKEYWRVHKIFKREMNKFYKDIFKMFKNPTEYINDFEELLNEGVRIGIIEQEFKEKKMIQLYDELASPSKFKEDVRNKIEKFKAKLVKKNKL